MKLRPRTRKAVVAATAGLIMAAGMAGAQAHLIGTSASFTTTKTIPLAAVPSTYQEVGEDLVHAYTPGLTNGSVTISVSASTPVVGAIVANTGFDCPASNPNPIVQLSLTGVSAEVRVSARIQGLTNLPDGTSEDFDLLLDPGTASKSANGMQLYKLCTA